MVMINETNYIKIIKYKPNLLAKVKVSNYRDQQIW